MYYNFLTIINFNCQTQYQKSMISRWAYSLLFNFVLQQRPHMVSHRGHIIPDNRIME